MKTGKLVFATRTIQPEARDVLLAEAPEGWHVTFYNPEQGEHQLVQQIENADFLVTYRSGRIPVKAIEKAKRLRLIQAMGQGTDHLPVRLAWEKGIYVANTGGYNAISVAELTVLLILATIRRLLPLSEFLRQGKFQGDLDITSVHELHNKTVGIVGFGNIGRRVAKIVCGFGANVIFYEIVNVPYTARVASKAQAVSLEDLLSNSDIVSLHVPSTENTKGMLGWREISMMKPTAYLINTSRGDIVDEAALIRALSEKKLAGAGLDVWEPEPPDPGNPLLHMDNVVATPHIGAFAWDNWRPRVQFIWENILRVWKGREPKNQIHELQIPRGRCQP